MMFRVTLLFASLLTANAFVLPLPRSSPFVASATTTPLYGKNKNKSVDTKTVEAKTVEATKVEEPKKVEEAKENDAKDLDIEALVNQAADFSVNDDGVLSSELIDEEVEDEKTLMDAEHMNLAIQVAQSPDGTSPYPKPIGGAVIATADGRILGKGRSDHQHDAVLHAVRDAGLSVVPLSEWVVSWPSSQKMRQDLKDATLYVTLEPSNDRKGDLSPAITQLIAQCGLTRVVIGCADPVNPTEGAAALHKAGLEVVLGSQEEVCADMIKDYTTLANSKLQRFARRHFARTGTPLGFLHCSVVDSDNKEAFARQGNAFGKDFGGKQLGSRDFGAYGIAPPPEVVWAGDIEDDFEMDGDNIFSMDFEDEEEVESIAKNPMMPWYEQVDAVVVTFPKMGNVDEEDDTVTGRMNGLKWLATIGESLPANVERILVMDATDLGELPLTNDNPNLPLGVDIESFWAAKDRKPTRVLLRKGENAQAQAAARAAAQAAQAAADAAQAALDAMESGQAAEAAEAAVKHQHAAQAATALVQAELSKAQALKSELTKRGVVLETLNGGEPIDVMKHIGKRSGYNSVVWRAGCWGERGVKAIMDGAFQFVSAHLAVDAVGGRFWQLMLAERAVQAACGPERKVKVYADQEDISLEYCDEEDADTDCVLTVKGQPVRHVRLDCRVALVDENRAREFVPLATSPMTARHLEEQAPWFL